jgi:peptide chain release factor 2
MAAPGFWDRPEEAQRTVAEMKREKRTVDEWGVEESSLSSVAEMLDLAESEGDQTMLVELSQELERVEGRFVNLQLKSLLSGEYDRLSALVAI